MPQECIASYRQTCPVAPANPGHGEPHPNLAHPCRPLFEPLLGPVVEDLLDVVGCEQAQELAVEIQINQPIQERRPCATCRRADDRYAPSTGRLLMISPIARRRSSAAAREGRGAIATFKQIGTIGISCPGVSRSMGE